MACAVLGLSPVSIMVLMPSACSSAMAVLLLWWPLRQPPGLGTVLNAVVIGLVSSVGGVLLSYAADTPSGGTIVLLAIGAFILAAAWSAVVGRVRRRAHVQAEGHPHEHGPGCGHDAVAHEGHVDYLHDGHRHAVHGGHYDEHATGQRVHR